MLTVLVRLRYCQEQRLSLVRRCSSLRSLPCEQNGLVGRAGTEWKMNPAEDNEPFVTPEEAAHFLKISPVTVKKMAREGWLPAHPIGNGVRKRWRFRISELVSHMRCRVESEASSGRSKASEGSQNRQGFSFM